MAVKVYHYRFAGSNCKFVNQFCSCHARCRQFYVFCKGYLAAILQCKKELIIVMVINVIFVNNNLKLTCLGKQIPNKICSPVPLYRNIRCNQRNLTLIVFNGSGNLYQVFCCAICRRGRNKQIVHRQPLVTVGNLIIFCIFGNNYQRLILNDICQSKLYSLLV